MNKTGKASLLHLGKRVFHKGWRIAYQTGISYPKIRECNVCGWRGRRFESDSWHPYTICPGCHSEVRHRLLAAALLNHESLSREQLLAGKKVLHFAPETAIGRLFDEHAGSYVTADYLRKDVELQLDISAMPFVKDGTFDVVVACDVLEHVEDDLKAMNEVLRILRAGGYAILTVPQKDDLEDTFEDKAITDPVERERIFGQWDHLRIYGKSFPRILESLGFKVTVISEKSFAPKLVTKNVLFPPRLSRHPLATNYRKVFFARKV